MRGMPRQIRRKIKRLRNGLDGEDGIGIQGNIGPKGDKGDKGDTGDPGSTRREEFFQGTTDASGNVTFSFSAFPSNPHVSFDMFPAPDANTYIRLVSLSTTSVTLRCEARTGLTVLAVTLLSFAVTPVSGVTVRARVAAV